MSARQNRQLRQPRWFFELVARWRDEWVLPCVNCGQVWTAWEWQLDGYPTTGQPGWCPEEFGLCTECATATPEVLAWRLSEAVPLDEYAAGFRARWRTRRLQEARP